MIMTDTDLMRRRSLKAACALLIGCAVAMFAIRALSDRLWSDELLTTTLLGARDLPKLWAGIVMGIDGNPPFYLTAAWLMTVALPQAMSLVVSLKLVNLVLTGVAVIALCHVGRRIISSEACWIGALLFVTLNDNVVRIAFELRTYALYFLMAALAVLLQQRLIERQRRGDVLGLAIVYVGLTLAHTFGVVYVGCIALAGALSELGGERSLLRSSCWRRGARSYASSWSSQNPMAGWSGQACRSFWKPCLRRKRPCGLRCWNCFVWRASLFPAPIKGLIFEQPSTIRDGRRGVMSSSSWPE